MAWILLILALALNIGKVQKSPPVSFLRSSAIALYFPLQNTAAFFSDRVVGFYHFVVYSRNLNNQNIELRKKIEKLSATQKVFENLAEENYSFRQALGFYGTNPYYFDLIPAEIIGRGGDSTSGTAMINKGSKAGVKAGLSVVNREGLVGKVIEVSPFSSKILLLTSAQSVVSAALSHTHTNGAVSGGYGGILKMKFVPEDTEIITRESVVVSPSSLDYQRGVKIGEISSSGKSADSLFLDISIKPSVNFSKLGVVFICKP